MRQISLLALFLSLAASIALAQPAIDAGGILNAASAQAVLSPNTVFVAYGKNLGPGAIVVATAPAYPKTLSGSSVTFTPSSGGSAIDGLMVYTVANAIAGVLPSSAAPGTYAVRVTYNGQTSAPQNVTVVARHFGISAANGVGTGVAQATIAQVNGGFSLTRYTTSGSGGAGNFVNSPAHPGDTISIWGTGGGADTANDTGGSSGDQTAAGNFKISISGRSVTPAYSAAVAGYPGLWVIDFVVPSDVTPDCYATVQVSTGAELSNSVNMPIAATGQSVCADPSLTPAILAKLDSGGSIIGGTFGIYRSTDTPTNTSVEGASGAVYKWTAAQWAAEGPARGQFGGCTVYDRTLPKGGVDPASPSTSLNAGAKLPISGPGMAAGAGLASTALTTGPVYVLSLTPGTVKSGSYTLTGNGGADVGPFTVTSQFPSAFTVTNWDAIASIDRTKPLTVNWTGTGVDQVTILVTTNTNVGTNVHSVTIDCVLPATLGSYTVPANLLAALQPAQTTGSSYGGLAVNGASNPGTFSATLTAGGQLDFGVFGPVLGYGKNIAVQ